MGKVILYKVSTKEVGLKEKYDFKLSEIAPNGLPYNCEEVEVVLPDGYRLAKTKWDELCIADPDGMVCHLDALNQTPRITSAKGQVLLKLERI